MKDLEYLIIIRITAERNTGAECQSFLFCQLSGALEEVKIETVKTA